MAPFDLASSLGSWAPYAAALLIGIGFGSVLELSGFGDSRKLAAQFYLRDMTVLKVMFTAIVVAMVLLTLSTALGLVDMGRLFVPPTYLLPGIVGGLVMGVGFIVGGFCPGTSLVSASTLKLDGVFFALGVTVGIFFFGETIHLYEDFWYSTALGRFVLPELFGLPQGVVVVAVVIMALFMFSMAEVAEAFFGRRKALVQLRWLPHRRVRMAAAAGLVALAMIALLIGQPSPESRWQAVAPTMAAQLEDRTVYIDPREVAEVAFDNSVYTHIIDVRSEADYNLFHLYNAVRKPLDQLVEPAFLRELSALPSNTAIFLVSNDETTATRGWQLLAGQGIPNLYIIEGGINGWLVRFPPKPCLASPLSEWRKRADEELAFVFHRAVGDCCNTARPEPPGRDLPTDCYLAANPDSRAHSAKHQADHKPGKEDFPRKVKLKKKAAIKGGCG